MGFFSKFLFGLSLVASICLSAGEPEFRPIHCQTLKKSGYDLVFDYRTRNAVFVHEKIEGRRRDYVASRGNESFREDSGILRIFRTCLQDFKGSGYDKGHLAAAGNHKDDPVCYKETFVLSNACPQHPKLNRVAWLALENYIREIAEASSVTDVYTGPLYLPYEENGRRLVKYEVIGEHEVAVPTHFFKVIRYTKADGKITEQAFILPNEPSLQGRTFRDYTSTIDKVEKASGIIFRP